MRGGPLAAVSCLLAGMALQAQVQTFSLPSGLRCVLLEKHDQPLIRVELSVRWDPALEARAGEAGFLAAVMRASGAGSRPLPEFSRALDDLGAAFGFRSRRDGFLWTLATDSRSQEPAMELLADAVFRPFIEEAQVEAQRLALAGRAADMAPGDLGKSRFLWSLGDAAEEFPPPGEEADDMNEGGPRGRNAPSPSPLVLPHAVAGQSPTTTSGITLEELQAFRSWALRPERATLVLHGDLSLAQAKELVHLHFGLWGPRALPRTVKPVPAPPREPRLLVTQDAGSHAEFWAGSRAQACSPAVREILGTLLAHMPVNPSPRITLGCSLGPGEPFLLKIKAGAAGRDGLVAAGLEALEHLRRGFPAREVEQARLRWKARMTALPLHPADQVHRLQEGALDPAFLAQVDAVGAKDVNEALAAMLVPGELHLLLTGADAGLVKKAEEAGLGPAIILNP